MTSASIASRRTRAGGFTLFEVMIVVAIIAILATIGVPIYKRTKLNAENINAVAEVKNISASLDRFILVSGHPPDSLADVGMAHMRDDWGNPYQYLRLDNLGKGGKGKARNLHPINSDDDLYCMGRTARPPRP